MALVGEAAKVKLEEVPGEMGAAVSLKMKQVLDRNPGFKFIRHLTRSLSGRSKTLPHPPTPGMDSAVVTQRKYCPIGE